MDSRHATLAERCRTGVEYGLFGAVGYSVFVIVTYVLSGGTNLDEKGITLPGAFLTYFGGGIGGGLIYGVLAPLAKWRLGAAVVGFFVSIPVWVGAMIILPDARLDSPIAWGTVAVAAVLVGGIGGFILWEPDR